MPKKPEKQSDKRTEYDVTPEEFIRAWQSSATAEEAAKKVGMPKAIAHARASNYRNMGIKLKRMPKVNKNGIDVEAMNLIAEEIYKEIGGKEAKPPAIKKDKPINVDQKAVRDLVKEVVEDHENKGG